MSDNKYKNHLCGEECDITCCPDEPCHCEHGLEQLQERATMRAELVRDNSAER
jgi:hypothetical protein